MARGPTNLRRSTPKLPVPSCIKRAFDAPAAGGATIVANRLSSGLIDRYLARTGYRAQTRVVGVFGLLGRPTCGTSSRHRRSVEAAALLRRR